MPDPEVMEAVKRKEKIVGLVDAVVEEAAAFLSATSATLFILDKEHEILWARRRGAPGTPNAGALQDLKIELKHRGAVSDADAGRGGGRGTFDAVHARLRCGRACRRSGPGCGQEVKRKGSRQWFHR
ncbi:unnamed protein product [Ectocarpus fasciculatus]